MTLPRKTPNSTRYARLAARGFLTRLALYFNAHGKKKFTGDEIALLLTNAVIAIGSPEISPISPIEDYAELLGIDMAGTLKKGGEKYGQWPDEARPDAAQEKDAGEGVRATRP